MMKRMMSKTIRNPNVNKKTVVIAATITTLLSATAAFAIKTFLKPKDDLMKEEKSEFEKVLDGLVEDGTITQAQQIVIQDAIQSAITTAKEADIVNDDLTIEENLEVSIVPDSNKTGTLTRLKNSLTKSSK